MQTFIIHFVDGKTTTMQNVKIVAENENEAVAKFYNENSGATVFRVEKEKLKKFCIELDNGKFVKVVDIYAENEKEAIEKAKQQYNLPIFAVRT